jgi:hypothetical protein
MELKYVERALSRKSLKVLLLSKLRLKYYTIDFFASYVR